MAINLNKSGETGGRRSNMAYNAPISRNNPTAFLFLIDQSGSMSEALPSGRPKSEQLADVINRTLTNLIIRCTKAEGVRDYFEVGVVSYSSKGIKNGFQGALSSVIMHPVSKIEANPLRVEERLKKIDDGAGGIIEQKILFPVWFEPVAYGSTPMRAALVKAAEEMAAWCDSHPDSYPPTILHITDGESNDGNPEQLAKQVATLGTNDGELLLFNLHLSDSPAPAAHFPSSEDSLPNSYAKMLYRMSSKLPPHLRDFALEKRFKVDSDSKGFIFNADAVEIVDFFDIGTRAAQMK